jgi:hypothetical protein
MTEKPKDEYWKYRRYLDNAIHGRYPLIKEYLAFIFGPRNPSPPINQPLTILKK